MDKLTKQLLGRYVDCRLQVRTTVPSFEIQLFKGRIEDVIHQRMREAIANTLQKSSHVNLRSYYDPDYIDKVVELSTYCFSKEELEKLIDDCFNAGVESAKAESN